VDFFLAAKVGVVLLGFLQILGNDGFHPNGNPYVHNAVIRSAIAHGGEWVAVEGVDRSRYGAKMLVEPLNSWISAFPVCHEEDGMRYELREAGPEGGRFHYLTYAPVGKPLLAIGDDGQVAMCDGLSGTAAVETMDVGACPVVGQDGVAEDSVLSPNAGQVFEESYEMQPGRIPVAIHRRGYR
jgi:hypothetical protein